MLYVDYQNALSDKIGLANGISKRSFLGELKKNQPSLKTIFRSKNKEEYAFLDLPDDQATLRKIKAWAKGQEKNRWENIILLGIGGSALGAIAVRKALTGHCQNLKNRPRFFIIDNIDPDPIAELLSVADPVKSLFIVISKSGGTTEPLALYSIFREKLEEKKVKNLKKHFVFITGPQKNPLRTLAKKEGFDLFDVPPKIGGRFSVLSAVGLLPAVLMKVDTSALLKGAKKMRDLIKKIHPEENPALILACLQYLLDKKKEKGMTVLMPYSSRLFRMGDWYRQLLAESIGKKSTVGPTPITALGTTDQHSQLQLYCEGPANKWFIFFRVLKHKNEIKLGSHLPKELDFLNHKKLNQIIDAALQGTSESLTKNKRPNVTIEIPTIDAESLGMLFMLFEIQIALLGLMYKVNAFSQPGVEEGKKITKKLLSK
ncbi:glucose-6-phosphate isomerase [Candidatus Peregrinibacteria bacterium]|nr:glucose-6-phosphate isomerase [Candidatus Peregrinibacteria bacterium]